MKHDLFLALLKSRYGYSNDKAVVELERLLREFDITNKSLGVKRAQPIRNFCGPDEQGIDLMLKKIHAKEG